MGAKIHVHVVKYQDCRNLILRYKDPATGKYIRSTKYRDPKTGQETETGDNRKHARKLAALWEADLNNGLAVGPGAITWAQFRDRYEKEVVPSLAKRTGDKINSVFNTVERILPAVASGKLADLTPQALSRLQAELRSAGRSENTIASHLAHLRASLRWAMDQGMIHSVPKIKRPQRARKYYRGSKSKGRPITLEEFERMLDKVEPALIEMQRRKAVYSKRRSKKHIAAKPTLPTAIDPAIIETWRHYLRGLWLSGLRLGESLELYWNRQDRLCIDLTGKRPMLRIPAECEKGNKDRRLPLTPDFAEFLLATPADRRHGPVFNPTMPTGNRAVDQAGRVLVLIGELARVGVHTDSKTGKVKNASAHDLRRSFGNRWARRVTTAVLQKLMRHESIETTMGYYVDFDTDELAEDLYKAHDAAKMNEKSTVLGTVDDSSENRTMQPSAGCLDSLTGCDSVRKHARQDSNLQPAD
jgi:integrase